MLPSSSNEVAVVAADSVVDDEAAAAAGMLCNIPSRHAALRQWTNDAAEKR